MSKADLVTHLKALNQTVLDYTSADYSGGGANPYTPEVTALMKSNYEAISNAEVVWREYIDGIDVSSVGVPQLQSALSAYNSGLDTWQQTQEQGIATWDRCIAEGGDSAAISYCMLTGHSIDEEQKSLAAYTDGLKTLLGALGVNL